MAIAPLQICCSDFMTFLFLYYYFFCSFFLWKETLLMSAKIIPWRAGKKPALIFVNHKSCHAPLPFSPARRYKILGIPCGHSALRVALIVWLFQLVTTLSRSSCKRSIKQKRKHFLKIRKKIRGLYKINNTSFTIRKLLVDIHARWKKYHHRKWQKKKIPKGSCFWLKFRVACCLWTIFDSNFEIKCNAKNSDFRLGKKKWLQRNKITKLFEFTVSLVKSRKNAKKKIAA